LIGGGVGVREKESRAGESNGHENSNGGIDKYCTKAIQMNDGVGDGKKLALHITISVRLCARRTEVKKKTDGKLDRGNA